ncbi:MAG: septum formation protein Maf [Clostridiales bacterium]|nr:septum formation protein Maf [Candidatus Crickella equi]
MKKVILASKSPRRLEIMRAHGINPIVMPSNAEEHLPDGIGMEDAVKMLAEQKARATYEAIKSDPSFAQNPDYRDAVIVGSDTIVYKDEILGKPRDYDDAFRMLAALRGTDHNVATGVALIDVNTGKISVLSDVTTVYCKDYSDEQIREYIENGQPYDKAGSYAIQGPFREYIDHYDGDYENVVGLPFYRIESMLK